MNKWPNKWSHDKQFTDITLIRFNFIYIHCICILLEKYIIYLYKLLETGKKRCI